MPQQGSILIIDDSEGNRITFRTILEGLGHPIDLAPSGFEGIRLAALKEYSVILSDVRMPMMDGFETAERIRQSRLNHHTPIIFVSGYDFTPMHVEKGYRAGATDYIMSPVDEKVLKHKVAAFIAISLRNRAQNDQLLEVKEILAKLQKEVGDCRPAQEALAARVEELERAMADLSRELTANSNPR